MRMTLLVLSLFAVACDDEKQTVMDAAASIDGPFDASIDAPMPDAPPSAIDKACKTACDKLATCAMAPADPECNAECAADLVDCTPQQLQDLEACAALDCDGGESNPFVDCLQMIACVMG
ncbi:MAG: hypothetical protein H6Q90_4804 [Deltaproteobacteria bacterium]|nr:hypothetical protein [Deltaproteobacteria bacterium]